MSNLERNKRVKDLAIFIGLVLWALLSACGKKCPSTNQTPLTSVVDADKGFRLVSTTNPTMKVSNFQFIVLKFERNFTGEVYKIENNNQSQTPTLTFIADFDSASKLMRIQYTDPSAGISSGSGSSQTSGTSPVVEYRYKLGVGLDLTETSTGYNYRFVVFNGVLDPDAAACTW